MAAEQIWMKIASSFNPTSQIENQNPNENQAPVSEKSQVSQNAPESPERSLSIEKEKVIIPSQMKRSRKVQVDLAAKKTKPRNQEKCNYKSSNAETDTNHDVIKPPLLPKKLNKAKGNVKGLKRVKSLESLEKMKSDNIQRVLKAQEKQIEAQAYIIEKFQKLLQTQNSNNHAQNPSSGVRRPVKQKESIEGPTWQRPPTIIPKENNCFTQRVLRNNLQQNQTEKVTGPAITPKPKKNVENSEENLVTMTESEYQDIVTKLEALEGLVAQMKLQYLEESKSQPDFKDDSILKPSSTSA